MKGYWCREKTTRGVFASAIPTDQESPTHRFGFGRSDSGLVSDPELSTGISNKNTVDHKTRDGSKR